ncbi:hypothetical protein [Exiguobacterium artemiae]|uniref:hypothetical protein n=1 Tax=Exiguobacterium artemiae TaxID=340145 RepID=UPI002964B324|nr:hypothetical protein [Exiguobacterium sibiricum]MDW2886658.1 hypothetical protein [Exiguobacterium sibiricum]
MQHQHTFLCPKCGEKFTESFELQDLEPVSWDERGMGTETQYDFSGEVTCPECKHEIVISGEAWEYPEGAGLNPIEVTSYE